MYYCDVEDLAGLHESVHSLLIEAADFYGDFLLKRKIAKKLKLFIMIDHNAESYGVCEIINLDDYAFRVILKPNDKYDLLDILAHEMVHVKQISLGELECFPGYCLWKGTKILEETSWEEYVELPWEKEAFRLSPLIYNKFLQKEYKRAA